MSELLNFIRDLFASIFTGNVKTSRLHRELKIVWRELRQRNPSFFRPRTNEILPAFAEAVYRWSQYARYLTALFQKTILNENGRMAELYRDHLVESKLDEKDRFKKNNFTYAAMNARLSQSPSFRDTLADITRDFEDYLSLFRQPEFATCDEEFANIERLALLSRYPYEKILSFFDPGTATMDRNYKPTFVPVLAQNATQELMDFYFSIAELDLGKNVAENVVLLFRRYRKTQDKEGEEKVRKIVSLLDTLRKKQLSRETLLCLIRLSGEDPRLSLPADRAAAAALELYKARFLSRFELVREKLLREHSQSRVAGDVSVLFGQSPLLEPRCYTDGLSNELQEEGFPSFTHLQALRILKSFVVLLYEKSIKEHLQQLVIEGYFEQKTFKDRFIALFHETLNAVDKITMFETSLGELGDVSVAKVTEYLEKHKNGKTVTASLNQLVETINDNVSRLLEATVNSFVRFRVAFDELLADAKQLTPSIVSNIRVIGGDRNSEIMKRLAADRDAISLFLDIMKNFTVIRRPAASPEEALRRSVGGR
ncbi:MAG: hypothetical protein JXD23_17495 [Spirochaetales bacterium]|nr:hypothetical protein [Spirochaetales bacterium]